MTAARVADAAAAADPFTSFFSGEIFRRRVQCAEPCDFLFGNPHDDPIPEMVEAIRAAAVPQSPNWFAYRFNHEPAQQAVAAALHARLGTRFAAQDVTLTKGAGSAIAVALQALVEAGDEVVFISPPWFFYEAMIRSAGAAAIRVPTARGGFDLDLDALATAITPRTRMVIVNSPNNPTGRIYPPETLRALAALLTDASARADRTVWLLSDEAYHRILFPGAVFTSPTAYYSHSLLVYSYGKTLLNPGQRLGYIVLPPTMPADEAASLRKAFLLTQICSGAWFPDAVMQYALPALEPLCIDLPRLTRRRDLLVAALREQGYDLHAPEATFYLLPRSPIPDDEEFATLLAAEDVFVLPGHVVELPGYLRISLTANDDMVARSVQGFARARHKALHR
jgi:aspartate aminotransferase